MRSKLLSTLLAVISLSTPLIVKADVEPGSWMVRARAVKLNWENGQKDGLSTANVTAKNTWIPEVDISYFFTKNIATELVLTYPQQVDINVGGVKAGTIKALPPSLLIQYHFTDLGAIKPYLGAGVNYTIFSDRRNILGGVASVDKTSFGLVAQAGMDYAFNKNWSVNLDVKYIQINTDVAVNGTRIGKLNLNPITPSIGVGYRF